MVNTFFVEKVNFHDISPNSLHFLFQKYYVFFDFLLSIEISFQSTIQNEMKTIDDKLHHKYDIHIPIFNRLWEKYE